jgi:O-antigen/teichoic acid export membrane protein
MNLKQYIFKGFFISTGVNYLCYILNFGKSIILARLIAPEYFGIIAIAYFFFGLCNRFNNVLGSKNALIYRQDNLEEGYQTYFFLSVLVFLVSLLITFFLSFFLYFKYSKHILMIVWVLLGFSFCEIVTSVLQIKLLKEFKFKRLAVVQLAATCISFFITVLLAYKGFKLKALVFDRITIYIVSAVFLFFLCKWRPSIKIKKFDFRWFFNYGKFFWAIDLVNFVSTEIDKLFVGNMLGVRNLGFYNKAFNHSKLPLVLITHLGAGTVRTVYSKVYDYKVKLSFIFSLYNEVILRFMVIILGGLFFVAPQLILLMLGEVWMPMAPVFRIFILLILIRSIRDNLMEFFFAIGKPNCTIKATMIELILVLILVPLSCFFRGIEGAAFSVVLAFLVGLICLFYEVKKYIDISIKRFIVAPLFSIIGGSIILSIVFNYLKIDSLSIEIFIKLILLFFTYMILLLCIEKEKIVQKIRFFYNLVKGNEDLLMKQ